MTEINLKTNRYLYGKFYDTSRVKIPTDEQNWDIIIYNYPLGDFNRCIGSLEGFFVSEDRLKIEQGYDKPCRRDQMSDFEKKYNGKFIPFDK